MNTKIVRRIKRHKKIKKAVLGARSIPRLVVYRSNKHIYASLIDDSNGKMITTANEKGITKPGTKSEKAYEVGKMLAKKAVEKRVKSVIFDRGGYQYHGRVESLAKGARDGGLLF
ncbi:50S ribosomal protein L18 [Candidatus Gottesmanbacteria bacterium]|nr:50S ribosomal protein L18 [Candidatus Gottesmanbacteria bacterium]